MYNKKGNPKPNPAKGVHTPAVPTKETRIEKGSSIVTIKKSK